MVWPRGRQAKLRAKKERAVSWRAGMGVDDPQEVCGRGARSSFLCIRARVRQRIPRVDENEVGENEEKQVAACRLSVLAAAGLDSPPYDDSCRKTLGCGADIVSFAQMDRQEIMEFFDKLDLVRFYLILKNFTK
jgi:hypothetical protein